MPLINDETQGIEQGGAILSTDPKRSLTKNTSCMDDQNNENVKFVMLKGEIYMSCIRISRKHVMLYLLVTVWTYWVMLCTSCAAEAYERIDEVKNPDYMSEYSLAVTSFFQPDVWEALDPDCYAYILTATVDNESNYFGITPRFRVEVDELGYKLFEEDIQIDERYIIQCGQTTFGFQPDQTGGIITMDRKFLSELDATQALFVCHKAFYYAYARQMVEQFERDELPERYRECAMQLQQYREDLKRFDDGESCQTTQLEQDATLFGMIRSAHYISYLYPKQTEELTDWQYRFLWRECLNGIYKQDLLQQLFDGICEDYFPEISCHIISSPEELREQREKNQECIYVLLDEEMIWQGEAADCIAAVLQALDLPGDGQKLYEKQNNQMKWYFEEALRRMRKAVLIRDKSAL